MPKLIFELDVEMEDGTTYTVVSDQRDLAKYEVQPFSVSLQNIDDKPLGMLRFLAWSASTRQQLTKLTWPEFDEKCVETLPVDDEESTVPDDAADPTKPAVSGEPT